MEGKKRGDREVELVLVRLVGVVALLLNKPAGNHIGLARKGKEERMIFQRKVDHPWHYNVKIIEYVCTSCGGIQPHRWKNNGQCSYCKRR